MNRRMIVLLMLWQIRISQIGLLLVRRFLSQSNDSHNQVMYKPLLLYSKESCADYREERETLEIQFTTPRPSKSLFL